MYYISYAISRTTTVYAKKIYRKKRKLWKNKKKNVYIVLFEATYA